jgi:hypothetical protein
MDFINDAANPIRSSVKTFQNYQSPKPSIKGVAAGAAEKKVAEEVC